MEGGIYVIKSSASLCTSARFRDRALAEVEKDSFITLPGKGGCSRLMLSKLCPIFEKIMRNFMVQRGHISLWIYFWLVGGKVKGVTVTNLQVPTSLRYWIPPRASFRICKTAQRYCCAYWWGIRTLPQDCSTVSPDCFFLSCLASLSFLTAAWICLLKQGMSCRLNEGYFL